MAKLTWDELYDKFGEMVRFDECEIEEICLQNGWNCDFSDSGIDDGICSEDEEDDEKDIYVLYASYDISDGNETHHLIFYYGDCTRIIGDMMER